MNNTRYEDFCNRMRVYRKRLGYNQADIGKELGISQNDYSKRENGLIMISYDNLKKLQEIGMDIDELAQWVEANKLHVCHNVTVDDLNHLQRGGRVSKTAAILGTMVQIKPIIHMDNEGCLQVIGKERGRKKSIHKLVDMALKQYEGYENDLVMITHGDCIEDAEYLAGLVREKMGIQEILINNIGTVIGSHTGPGVLALFCMGNER